MSDLYEKMVFRMNLALLLKKLWFAFYLGGHVGFYELQEFPKMSSWATVLKCKPDQQFMEHLKMSP